MIFKRQKNFTNLFRSFFPKHKKENRIISYFKKAKPYFWFINKILKPRESRIEKKARLIIPWIIWLFLIISIISFLPNKEKIQLVQTDNGIDYNFMHWAATWRDFLFEWETWHDSNLVIDETDTEDENKSGSQQVLYTWTMNWVSLWSKPTTWNSIIEKDSVINAEKTTTNPESKIISGNTVILPKDVSKYIITKLKQQIKQQRLLAEKINKDCFTPRKSTIKHWDFVIAYEQRKDIPNFCNAEKRYCNDWSLEWSFLQKECNEKIEYQYTEIEAKSQTKAKVDPYIQTKKPTNDWADFSINWKINEKNIISTEFQYGPSWSQIINSKETWLKYIIGSSDCKSPRWDTVKNWQFVIAYQAPLGFINLECKSEFRYCTDGKLWWSYSYKACKYKDMTYNDFLVWNYDIDKATTLDLMENIDPESESDSASIRKKIQSLFR